MGERVFQTMYDIVDVHSGTMQIRIMTWPTVTNKQECRWGGGVYYRNVPLSTLQEIQSREYVVV